MNEISNRSKLSIAAAKIQTIKSKIQDLKELNLFPANQLQDQINFFDALCRKQMMKIEKEERTQKISTTYIQKE